MLVAGVPAFAQHVDRPAQRVAMAVIGGVGFSQDDGFDVHVQLAVNRDRRALSRGRASESWIVSQCKQQQRWNK